MSTKLPTRPTNVSMDRQTADRLVAVLVISILTVGGYATLRAYWRLRTTSGMMQMMPGMDPLWYAFGTLIAVSAVLGTYALARDTFTTTPTGTDDTETNRDTETNTEQEQTKTASVRDSDHKDTPAPRLLDMLPEDEQRVIEPVLDTPGLTQVELRARSDFSKAKVSQTVTELEDRGLLYRETQGRTYRVYPGELLKDEDQQ
ncbi:helix-turn-helix transcriptional regulator [Saliphagus infecundisoli]|uniref:Helix-turn-helix transcriptional regulator n=1 Tax=Saliphagus infecundisoli TaxID=1849069 RepID=A0ABD5QC80_9EURY|nr:MarR family transcriptional regulator [Saliphagus infecundisoli]